MRRTRFYSVIAVLTSSSLLLETIAHAYPANVFATTSAVPTPVAGKETKPGLGSDRVDSSGAATYSIPVPVAPNRNGAVPRLSLSYSSKNPLRGGLAMGWSLAISKIEVDTSKGRLAGTRYRSSEGGKLIRVSEPVEAGWEAYRGEEDSAFTRFERKAGVPAAEWRARTVDGTVHYFGETLASKDANHPHAAPAATEARWFITRTVDKFGNEIRYNYSQVLGTPPEGGAFMPVDIALASVEYGANPGAGLAHHTRIVFDYEPTPDLCTGSVMPIGARFDFRTGIPLYEGAMRLNRIRLETSSSGPLVERRRLDLTYDPGELQCGTNTAHAPLRILTSVQETGFAENGTPTVLPAQTFEYNRLERTLDVSSPADASVLSHGEEWEEPAFGSIQKQRDRTDGLFADIDGDGRADKIASVVGPSANPTHCTATWQKNLGGTFAASAPFGLASAGGPVLPTSPWEDGVARASYEVCGLTNQTTLRKNRTAFEPYDPDTCSPPPTAPKRSTNTRQSYRFMDWDHDGLTDLVTSIESRRDVYRPELDPLVGPPADCSNSFCDGTLVSGLGCVLTNEDVCQRTEERACHGHVLRIHKNLGGGVFAAPVAIVSPVPLEAQAGRPYSRQPEIDALLSDVDGDGWLDAIRYDGAPTDADPTHTYSVKLGLHDGTFASTAHVFDLPLARGFQPGSNEPEEWLNLAPSIPYHERQETGFPVDPDSDADGVAIFTEGWSWDGVRLFDVNGDGLDDLVWAAGNYGMSSEVRVFYNTGAGFLRYESLPANQRGHVVSNEVFALDATQEVPKVSITGNGLPQSDGPSYSRAVYRSVDFDGDGLMDLVALPIGEVVESWEEPMPPWTPEFDEQFAPVELFINVGDRYVSAGASPALRAAAPALSRRMRTTKAFSTRFWHYESDFVDIDGDGLPEAIDDPLLGSAVALSDSEAQPLRALKAINNGRGGRIEFHYTVITGQAVPHPLWVVDYLVSKGGEDAEGTQPPTTTAFTYQDPVYGPDLQGDYAFRGFQTMTTFAPSGARSKTTRSYNQYYGGLVTEERVYTSDDHLTSRTTTTYEERLLFENDAFPGTVRTFHPTVVVTRACRASQSEIACAGAGDRSTHETFYVALAAPGQSPSMHVVQFDRHGENVGNIQGSRGTWYVNDLLADASTYLRVPVGEVRFSYGAGGVPTVDAETWHYYDATKRVEYWTTRKVDETPHYAVTTHDFDLTTGNVILEIAPRYWGTGPGSSYLYDAQKRFVTAVINPMNQRVDSTHDPATGQKTSERGPNARSCGAGCTIKAGWSKTYDGLGRELTHTDYLDDAVLGYKPELVRVTSYLDTALPRTMVTKQEKIDIGGTRFTKTEVENDGFGRPIIERVYEDTTVRSESRRFYDSRGLITRVSVPNPGLATVQFVDWTYEYDDLGRMVAMREPTRAGCSGSISTAPPFYYCGRLWTYDGRVTTAEDVVGTIGGQVARTRSTIDALGRLAKVEEQQGDGSWAVTTYGFDGLDNVVRVENADGVVTTMTHDMLGHRTSVTRGGNVWLFTFDLNGNLESVTSPVPPNGTSADYTTTMTHDALNRETDRVVAPRDWGAPELARFGTGNIHRTYDQGVNGVGRLSSATLEWGIPDGHSVSYAYEARGLVSSETHEFTILDGQYQDARALERTYTAHGRLATATEADGATPATSTVLVTAYDGRGLPAAIEWLGHGLVQEVERTADGRVSHRQWSNGATVFAQSNTAFDDTGRVLSYDVGSRLPGTAQISERASQSYSFDGAGDVFGFDTRLSPSWELGALSSAIYSYDSMHRLVSATGDVGYAASFSYSPGGRITGAAITADPQAARVRARNVAYTYVSAAAGAVGDPDAPAALSNNGGTGNFMTIEYDHAGNAITRTTTDGVFEHLYDGLDRQREVIAPSGSELYYYGADGMRALTVTLDANSDPQRIKWTLGGTEVWYDASGDVEKEVATTDIDGAVARIEDHDHRELMFQDPRGHTLAVIAENGSLLAGFSYGPYGELLREIGPEKDDYLKRFNGKEYDVTSGLSYYGFRYYDDRSLTWTQADPKYRWEVEAGSTKPRDAALYAFSNGNPVIYFDRDGRQPKVIENRGGTVPEPEVEVAVPLETAIKNPEEFYANEFASAASGLILDARDKRSDLESAASAQLIAAAAQRLLAPLGMGSTAKAAALEASAAKNEERIKGITVLLGGLAPIAVGDLKRVNNGAKRDVGFARAMTLVRRTIATIHEEANEPSALGGGGVITRRLPKSQADLIKVHAAAPKIDVPSARTQLFLEFMSLYGN